MLAVAAAVSLVACDTNKSNGPDLSRYPLEKLDGFIFVQSSGDSTVLGTNDSLAKPSERPEMTVAFDYDFWLGEHEVTCGEYAELMDVSCEEKDLPVVDVTYFDAVYFANAKSRKAGLDTAYFYNKATFDGDGHCTNLEGLSLITQAKGFRLPTEAEWVYAASKSWNPKDSWNSENSDYKAHEVCSKRSKSEGFCDLAGNVLEWTNDLLGFYKDTTIMNYAGAPDVGFRGERVVKGGSFRNAPEAIMLVSRGDVYAVVSGTRTAYVGFRLAYGAISEATWFSQDGSANESRAIVLATTQKMRNKTGTYRNKLVFRNDMTGNLAYVDFSFGGQLTAVEIADTIDAYHPDISPDGSKVAFCTGREGLSQKSSLYVRNLDASGSGLVKLDVESAAIPRWRVTDAGDTVIVYVTNAGDNSDAASFLSQSTWQVPFAGGKFGATQKLFDGAYHGGVSADNSLAVTGSTRLRARISRDATPKSGASVLDTVWYNGEQACNVSLVKDGSNRSLFLDFASASGREFVGSKYRVHERVFVADSNGKLLQSMAAPEGYSFDHTEWTLGGASSLAASLGGASSLAASSAASSMAVAALANGSGAHTEIVLLDFADSSVTELAMGEELWHPCLWSAAPFLQSADETLDLDSAGVYLSENHDEYKAVFRIRMETYWKHLDDTKVLVTGSSRAKAGVDPDMFPEWKMLNIAVTGVDANRDLSILENYVMNHADSLDAIVLSIDLDGWRGEPDFWTMIKKGAPGYIYDENHGFWADSIPANFLRAVSESFPAEAYVSNQFTERGGSTMPARSWDSEGVQFYFDSTFTDAENKALDSYLGRLVALADQAAEKKIYLIGILFPQSPRYKNTGSLGICGMQRSEAAEKIAWLDSVAQEKPYFVFVDENKMGDHDYTDEMAYNMDHLSPAGAAQLTTRLDSLLKTLK